MFKNLLKLLIIFTLLTVCSTDNNNDELSLIETTTTQPATTTTEPINNVKLSLTPNSLSGKVTQSVNIRLTVDEWKGSIGSSQVFLREEPFKVLYNWIGGISLFTDGLDSLIQAESSSGMIGTKSYSINISSGVWSGFIDGEKFKINSNNGVFEGYGPKEVVLLIIIYSN